MELHQLRYMVAVARLGNFSRAAEHCRVAQPSLSQQIQKLEEELGERLFQRSKNGARLTAAGESFLPRATRILEEVEAAHRDVQETRDLNRGQVSVGVLPTIAPYFLPPVIAKFNAAHPGIEIMVQEDITTRLLKMVLAFEIDLAVVSLPLTETGLETQNLFQEELLLALPPDHALVKQRSIKAADLEGQPFIVMKEGHCLGDQILSFCTRRDFQPNVSCQSAQIETMQSLVEAGLGISLVPSMACSPLHHRTIVYRSLDNPKPTRAIVAVWPSQRPLHRAAKEFLQHLRKAKPASKKSV